MRYFLLNEGENKLHDFIFKEKRNLLETATSTNGKSPLIIFVIILVFDFNLLNTPQKKFDKFLFGFVDIAQDNRAFKGAFNLLFGDGGPKLDSLSSDLLFIVYCCFVSELNQVFIVVLNGVVFLGSNFY